MQYSEDVESCEFSLDHITSIDCQSLTQSLLVSWTTRTSR